MDEPASTREVGSRKMKTQPWWIAIPIIVVVPIVIIWWACTGPVTTVLLVRHAEKTGSGDVDLSTAGFARADTLARVMEKAELDAIYTTDLKRTRQTADPTEAATGLTATEFGPFETEALVDHILDNHTGATVLVVGHSNTVDDVIKELGGPAIGDLSEAEFDNLFVLERCCWWTTRLTNLQYGEASP
jgi:phosphohistidine phosphatase SixA